MMIASMVIGAATAAYGSYQQGQAAEKMGNYQSAVARNNAIIAMNNKTLAERAAADAEERGKIAGRQQQIATEQLKGRQQVMLAASGQLVNEGSALDIITDTAELGKFEELRIRNNAAREALGYRTEGMNYEAQAGVFESDAQMSQMAGQDAKNASNINAFGSLVEGAGSVAGKWNSFNFGGTKTYGTKGAGWSGGIFTPA